MNHPFSTCDVPGFVMKRCTRLALAGMIAALPLFADGLPAQAAARCFRMTATITGSGQIAGTPGDDVILGSNRNDQIDGGGGNDTICGGAGDDVIAPGWGDGSYVSIRIDGGPGNDTLDGASPEAESTNLIIGGSGNDTIAGGVYAENTLSGDDGNDRIWGADAATNHVTGGDGDDTIEGGHGATLFDGVIYAASNWLDGGPGDDILIGGSGLSAQTENDLLGDVGADHLTAGDYATNRLEAGRDGDIDVCVHSQIGSDTFNGCDIEQ